MMKKRFLWLLLAFLGIQTLLPAQTPRFLDTYQNDGKTLVLGICYPTLYALNSVIALRNEGFLPQKDLIVVGLYHKDEDSDYAGARQWVQDKALAWMKYHELQGDLTRENLWGDNGCTAEFENIFKQLHGLILFGGADIPPYVYGQKTLLLTGVSTPARHFFEASLIFHLLGGFQNQAHQALLDQRPDFPLLGLCLGEQTINVGTGGTLIQDIWFQKYKKSTVEDAIALGTERWHNNPWAKIYPKKGLIRYNMHPILLKADGMLIKKFGFTAADHPYVLSSHHQMVDRPGRDIQIIATSMDGKVPEAISHSTYPNVLGLQFHPEFETLYDPDFQARIEPEGEAFSLRSVLESQHPTYQFHQAIWRWFTDQMQNQQAK